MSGIRNRILLILALVTGSLWALRPTDLTYRVEDESGVIRDITERRWGLKQGLDLQGGMHLGIEIDQSRGAVPNLEDAIDRAVTVIRSRVDQYGVGEPLIQKAGDDRIIVELPGIDDPDRAIQLVQRSAFLEFRITDMENRFLDALPRIDAALQRLGVNAGGGEAGAAPSGLEGLLGQDSTEAESDSTDADTTAAEPTLDPTQPGPLTSLLMGGALQGEFLVAEENFPRVDSIINLPEVQRLIPRGLTLMWGREPFSQAARAFRGLYALDSRPMITGEQIADAQATIDQLQNFPVVTFQMTRGGARIFARETARNVGNYMAIVLDGRVNGRPPVINSRIARNGQIELGNSTLTEARDLALVLRAGALPAPIQIVERQQVGASLGEDSISKGITAGLVGIVLVIILMALYYRVAGVLAIVGLGFYVLFTLGGLAGLEATLTLPGLAGFILSLGIAVDANVLIFERIREELKLGKTVRLAVDTGFEKAMPAILDANVTTVITALFLFQFGTGPVKGFAVTLIIGIIASLITAVFVTRTFFMMWMHRRDAAKELSI